MYLFKNWDQLAQPERVIPLELECLQAWHCARPPSFSHSWPNPLLAAERLRTLDRKIDDTKRSLEKELDKIKESMQALSRACRCVACRCHTPRTGARCGCAPSCLPICLQGMLKSMQGDVRKLELSRRAIVTASVSAGATTMAMVGLFAAYIKHSA